MVEHKEIRFKNLPKLLNDMRNKKWIIDSFQFRYKEKSYIVLLTIYKEGERKPSEYAVAKIEFIKLNNISSSINAYIDFFNVYFNNSNEFCNFFNIENRFANRDLFNDFSGIFATYIPKEKIINKNEIERRIIGSRVEGGNPNAIYCYDVRRNGKKEDGSPNVRSIENSNKAEILRPKLYEKYSNDTNLSFFFSDDQNKEKSDEEIIKSFANR
ncbi:Uncharacterised protein [[Clostridium] sordellii]|uniref:DUF6037 family protein n=1 Tax=Clostridia TaxID=186801 RepID=UPI0005DBA521|nr:MULTISPECIES: DUF6037 family protein [Clostridia]BDC00663.1 hypothetical protein CP118TE_03720 [Clostridium perfringens E]CEO36656.1 Uncharacterised protein [[Clostridium] sordellii] [Paeniclostridium sordellii]